MRIGSDKDTGPALVFQISGTAFRQRTAPVLDMIKSGILPVYRLEEAAAVAITATNAG